MNKKIVAFMLMCMLCLTSCAERSQNKSDGPTSMEAVQDSDYSITFYWGPPLEDFTQETVEDMKAAGFDIIPIQRYPWDTEGIKRSLQILMDNGLDAAVTDGRITDIYNAQTVPSQDRIDTVVQKVVDDYRDYGNIKEWILCDEPNSSKFEVLGRLVDAFRRIDPDRKTFINLLPDYADNEMLGADSYDEYLQMFCETVKPDYICVDYYDFLSNGNITGTTVERHGTFLKNMESMKNAAEKYGIETRIIVLVTYHIEYSYVTPAEIAWQANLSLLYGTKSLSYFTYWRPDDKEYVSGMVQDDRELTQHYYDVQKENLKTRVLGDALYSAKCEKVFKIGTQLDYLKGPENYTSYGSLGQVDGSDMLVSFYNNGWFMIMNGLSLDTDENVRSVSTKDVNGILFWLNPETKVWESFHSCDGITQEENGQYTIKLRAGDSLLMRVEPAG